MQGLDELFDDAYRFSCLAEHCKHCEVDHLEGKHIYDICVTCSHRAPIGTLDKSSFQYGTVITCYTDVCNAGIMQAWRKNNWYPHPAHGPYGDLYAMGLERVAERQQH